MKTREQAAANYINENRKNLNSDSVFTIARSDLYEHWNDAFLAGCEFEAQNRWIPSVERLPERYERVIIDNGVGYIGRDGNWYTITGIEYPGIIIQWEVTHWQPFSTIPPKPQEL
jgi:hypothetical protein